MADLREKAEALRIDDVGMDTHNAAIARVLALFDEHVKEPTA